MLPLSFALHYRLYYCFFLAVTQTFSLSFSPCAFLGFVTIAFVFVRARINTDAKRLQKRYTGAVTQRRTDTKLTNRCVVESLRRNGAVVESSVGRQRSRWVGSMAWRYEGVGLQGCGTVGVAAGAAGAAGAARYKPVRVNNRPSDVIAPRDTSVAFKWLLSRLCLDADVDLWNSIKLYGIPYRPNRVAASRSKRSQTHVIFFTRARERAFRRLRRRLRCRCRCRPRYVYIACTFMVTFLLLS